MADLQQTLQKQRREAEERVAKRKAEKLGLSYLDLVSTKTPTEIKAMSVISEKEAKKAQLAPVQLVGKELVVAVYDLDDKKTKAALDKLRKKYEVSIVISSLFGLKHTWGYYSYIKEEGGEITGEVKINAEKMKEAQKKINTIESLTKSLDKFKKLQTSQVLETILAGAMALDSSDIHMEPGKKKNIFRLRVDGILHTVTENIESTIYRSLITRIKLLSNLKLNVRDEPQDGRFTITLPDRDIEIRTSIIPSEYGETVVMRLLDPDSLKVDLEALGWREDDLKIIQDELKKPNGLILTTGPTGSGKTTTLYAFLRRLAKPEIKVITVEDPIEYHIPGISQTQADPDAGYTFASGLRSVLRQDPDVILVGEIRDEETAGIALNASLTGHMVFSTLHTNDAVGALPRLLDLGSKPNVLGPALSLVIAQRLTRTLCKSCKKEKKTDKTTEEKIKKFLEKLPERVNVDNYKEIKIHEAVGCSDCGGLGYKGRTSIFELFAITEAVEKAIYSNPTEIELKKLAKEQGMVEVQEDGVLKVISGITSFEEIERLTGPINWE